MYMTTEELLAGGSLDYDIEIPSHILNPTNGNSDDSEHAQRTMVKLRPLTVKDIQLVAKGAKDDPTLMCSFMIQKALLQPELSVDKIARLHGGLVKFLIEKINLISGLAASENDLDSRVQTPLARACFILAKEFGWTPEQVSEMTVGQILLYLEMIKKDN